MSLKKFCTGLVIAASAACSSAFADPTSVSYVFSDSLSAGVPDMTVGSLTIQNVGANTLWTMSASWNAADHADAFVNSLAYGLEGNSVASLTGFSDGAFDVGYKGINKNDIRFATANSSARFTSGETVSWTLQNTQLNQFSNITLHVNEVFRNTSGKFLAVPQVPEPETYGMLLAGLGLVGVMARRRARKQS